MQPLTKPSPEAVRQARVSAGMTQEQAGLALFADGRGWRKYEAGDRAMSAPLWELFLLKTGQHPTMRLLGREHENDDGRIGEAT